VELELCKQRRLRRRQSNNNNNNSEGNAGIRVNKSIFFSVFRILQRQCKKVGLRKITKWGGVGGKEEEEVPGGDEGDGIRRVTDRKTESKVNEDEPDEFCCSCCFVFGRLLLSSFHCKKYAKQQQQ